MSNPDPKIAVVLLAAGSSNRMGQPKQLLEYRGQTMIERSVEVALSTGIRPLVVVLGANADRIAPLINGKGLHIVRNADWPLGMSTSLKMGMEKALELEPALEAILFLVVDQPYVTTQLLLEIAAKYRLEKTRIVAARYNEQPGVPALLDRSLFEELQSLTGDKGARALFKKYKQNLLTVSFPDGHFDLDTPSDYEQLKRED